MSDAYYIIHDDKGNALKVLLKDSGGGIYSLNAGRWAATVSPNDQASTASFADVVGSLIDTLNAANISFTILNNGANTIKWQVLADNDPAFGAAVTVKASATIAASATDTYTAAPAPYRYYKVQIADNVAASHGQSHLFGIAKG